MAVYSSVKKGIIKSKYLVSKLWNLNTSFIREQTKGTIKKLVGIATKSAYATVGWGAQQAETLVQSVLPKRDPFIRAKMRVSEIAMPKEYRTMFLEIMDDFSRYFKRHPEINVDIEKAFEKHLFGEDGLRIIIDEQKLDAEGDAGQFNGVKNILYLKHLDYENYRWQKEVITHEFTHFLYYSLNGAGTNIPKWLEEAMTEKIAMDVSRYHDFCSGYYEVMRVVDFINAHCKDENGKVLTPQAYLNGSIYDVLIRQVGINDECSSLIHRIQNTAYFDNFSYIQTAQEDISFASSMFKSVILSHTGESDLTAEQIASLGDIATMSPTGLQSFSAVLNLAQLNMYASDIDAKIINLSSSFFMDEYLEDKIRGVISDYEYSKNLKSGREKAVLNEQIQSAVDEINGYMRAHREVYKQVAKGYEEMQHNGITSSVDDIKLDEALQELTQYMAHPIGKEISYYILKNGVCDAFRQLPKIEYPNQIAEIAKGLEPGESLVFTEGEYSLFQDNYKVIATITKEDDGFVLNYDAYSYYGERLQSALYDNVLQDIYDKPQEEEQAFDIVSLVNQLSEEPEVAPQPERYEEQIEPIVEASEELLDLEKESDFVRDRERDKDRDIRE